MCSELCLNIGVVELHTIKCPPLKSWKAILCQLVNHNAMWSRSPPVRVWRSTSFMSSVHQGGEMVAGTGCDQSGTYLVVSCLCLGGVVCAAHPLLPVARTYHLCRCPFKLRAERHGRRWVCCRLLDEVVHSQASFLFARHGMQPCVVRSSSSSGMLYFTSHVSIPTNKYAGPVSM